MHTILLAVSMAILSATPTPNADEKALVNYINKQRKRVKQKALLINPTLCQMARQEMEIALTDREKAKGREQRLKASGMLDHGKSTMIFAANNRKHMLKQLKKQRAFNERLRQDYASIAAGVFKVPADPPFLQIMVIFIKAAPVDPCGGKPGLSETQVKSVQDKFQSSAQKCYLDLLEKTKNPNLAGMVTFAVKVAPNGTLASREKRRFDSELLGMQPCIDKVFKLVRFPKPCGEKPVSIATFGWSFTPHHGKQKIGYLTTGQQNSAIQRKRALITACYEKQLKKNKKLKGKVVLHFAIKGNGAIEEVSIKEDTLGSPPVRTCVLNIAKKLIFPAPKFKGRAEFDYPLNFSRNELKKKKK